MTTILDYGAGNLRSVRNAIAFLGFDCEVRERAEDADRLIVPGVGAFRSAMRALAPHADAIRAHAAAGRPLLGICLGQQLLFESSEEGGEPTPGLGLMKGSVRYLPSAPGLKIPHIGWNALEPAAETPLLRGLAPGSQAYFVHSLFTDAADPADVAATSTHGIAFPAAVWRENVWGVQFHPEKSGNVGLTILRNFLTC